MSHIRFILLSLVVEILKKVSCMVIQALLADVETAMRVCTITPGEDSDIRKIFWKEVP